MTNPSVGHCGVKKENSRGPLRKVEKHSRKTLTVGSVEGLILGEEGFTCEVEFSNTILGTKGINAYPQYEVDSRLNNGT
jgi:hypothetical protein